MWRDTNGDSFRESDFHADDGLRGTSQRNTSLLTNHIALTNLQDVSQVGVSAVGIVVGPSARSKGIGYSNDNYEGIIATSNGLSPQGTGVSTSSVFIEHFNGRIQPVCNEWRFDNESNFAIVHARLAFIEVRNISGYQLIGSSIKSALWICLQGTVGKARASAVVARVAAADKARSLNATIDGIVIRAVSLSQGCADEAKDEESFESFVHKL